MCDRVPSRVSPHGSNQNGAHYRIQFGRWTSRPRGYGGGRVASITMTIEAARAREAMQQRRGSKIGLTLWFRVKARRLSPDCFRPSQTRGVEDMVSHVQRMGTAAVWGPLGAGFLLARFRCGIGGDARRERRSCLRLCRTGSRPLERICPIREQSRSRARRADRPFVFSFTTKPPPTLQKHEHTHAHLISIVITHAHTART